MSISIGSPLPDVILTEYVQAPGDACTTGPVQHAVRDLARGRTIALFALPGAFTPTCSEQHLPGYLARYDDLKARGVDEIWCVSVNDAFVMEAWGRDQQVQGRVRMLADGAAAFTRAMGQVLDLTERGMGLRSRRYSALAVDGIVRQLNVEAPGKFEVSDADSLLAQL
ncbi:MAG: peroxiredoxin [Castellaniella sp.]